MKISSPRNITKLTVLTQSSNSNTVKVKKRIIKRKSKNYLHKRIVNKSVLPSPCVFYKQLGIELKENGNWRLINCPFHDYKHPSMGVNINHDGFICNTCSQSGDMLQFYMSYKNVNFVQACNELNLWEVPK